MTDKYDLIVAGAGPAGCTLAAKVASGGARVLLIERKDEPGRDRDWIVDVTRETFEVAAVPSPRADELFDEPGRTVLVTSDKSCEVELLPAPMIPVRNGPYIRRLAGWASECGARVETDTEVIRPVIEGDSVTGVRIRRGKDEASLRASVVADCTGIRGAVRCATPVGWGLAARVKPADTVLARRETRRIDLEGARSAVRRGLLSDRVRRDRVGSQGVYSVETCFVDLEAGFIDILIGLKPGSGPSADERFTAMISEYGFVGEKVFGDGGPIPIRRPLDAPAANGLVVLGDSACQVIPAHGSGTASALIAADLASGVVLRAIERGKADRKSLWGYCHAFQSGRGGLLAYYEVIKNHTESLSVRDLDEMIRKGIVGPREIYTGLVPEVPHVGLVDVLGKLRRGLGSLPELAAVAKAGMLAQRTLKHYRDYPPLDVPGALERWSSSMPGRTTL
jgi:flavin-dependent dehydrogenase